MKKLTFLFVFLLALPLCAKKKVTVTPATPAPPKMKVLYKNAHLAIKNNANQEPAKAALIQALARPELSNDDKAKVYYTCALLAQSNNAVQNQRAYLKQMTKPEDSIALFNTILDMYRHIQHCDSFDAIPNSRGHVSLKYKKKTQTLMQRHRPNLLTGGKFFLKRKDYANAYNFLDMYMSTSTDTTETDYNRVSYWATISAYNTNQTLNTLKYSVHAITFADAEYKPILQEYRVRCYQKLKSNEAYLRELQVGVNQYPNYDFFFVNLTDLYYLQKKYDEGLALADSLISLNGDKAMYWYAKGLMYLGKQEFEKCIVYSDSCISRDPKYVDAFFNKGIAYCNLALVAQENASKNMSDSKWIEDQKKIQDLYQLAKPCMEMVRTLQPENKERWGRPLYRIYLYLNMGKEFDEIDKLLKAQ